ncbi:PepSY-associated TM helix domain-containing protein [Pedobacter aquatilis]|uniref:PepSY-associated TM helix domain-containing protein n=1 Tax=Pedobacter aquatilis TaxID=351343 RepID=UPI00293176F9|nr:PepSY-associated TM helix domain-containing protein [Pedobacter aquatilis]
MKNIWRNIHLWLGLAAGLIFFVECLSGTLLVFEDEITFMLYKNRYEVVSGSQPRINLDDLLFKVRKNHPEETIGQVKVYKDLNRTTEVNLSLKQKNKKGEAKDKKVEEGGGRKRNRGYTLFVDPYTGKETGRLNPEKPTFFSLMLKIHQTLLAGDIGKSILGISTFMVFTILITGLVLWFPKKRKQLKAKVTLKVGAGWKRLNHDLHIVLGFYCTFFLLIILITSLAWSFKWANKALYTFTGSKPSEFKTYKSISPIEKENKITYQQALEIGQSKFANTDYWSISMPKSEEQTISVSSVNKDALHRNGFDNLSLDQRTGAVINSTLLKDMPGGWQLRRYMKPIHTGAIGGFSTKLLAFLVSLISASFPITGTILWLNRIKKKKKGVSKEKLAHA